MRGLLQVWVEQKTRAGQAQVFLLFADYGFTTA